MKPILFNGDMVRAILDGRKTVTRRPVDWDIPNSFDVDTDGSAYAYINQATGDSYKPEEICRYKVGDILYVRETFFEHKGKYYYRADDFHKNLDAMFGKSFFKWRPSIHMPREAARIFLRVTGVRVERLQEITDGGAMCEGVKMDNDDDLKQYGYKAGFKGAWDSIYSAKGYGWKQNPWVWVIEFEKVKL